MGNGGGKVGNDASVSIEGDVPRDLNLAERRAFSSQRLEKFV